MEKFRIRIISTNRVSEMVAGQFEFSQASAFTRRYSSMNLSTCPTTADRMKVFMLDRSGCVVKKKHRWQMNNVDAKRVRECFDGR